jgi:hypothetical protein
MNTDRPLGLGALLPDTTVIILIVGVGLLGASIFFLTRRRKLWGVEPTELTAIGSSLLTGSLIALAIFGLQFYLDQEEQEESKEEQFRLTLAVATDLTGLDPPLPLAGLNLPDKVLDRAQLARDDLTDANFAGASLKFAILKGADLEGANLFGANLRGAVLTGATLDHANLATANLRDTTIYGRRGIDVDLEGTAVDARTCWPADFLISAAPDVARLREQLRPQPVQRTGRTILEESIGHACELTFDNVVQHLQQPDPPPTVQALANPYDLDPHEFLSSLEGKRGQPKTGAPPLTLNSRLCAGSRRVLARHQGWRDAAAVLILRGPDEDLGAASAQLVGRGRREPRRGKDRARDRAEARAPLRDRLERGSEALLLGAVSASQIDPNPDYSLQRRASPC